MTIPPSPHHWTHFYQNPHQLLQLLTQCPSGPKMQETIQSSFTFHLIKARINLPQGSYAEGITTCASTKLYCLIDKARVMFLFCMHNLFDMGIFHFLVTPEDKGALWVIFFFSDTYSDNSLKERHYSSPLVANLDVYLESFDWILKLVLICNTDI